MRAWATELPPVWVTWKVVASPAVVESFHCTVKVTPFCVALSLWA